MHSVPSKCVLFGYLSPWMHSLRLLLAYLPERDKLAEKTKPLSFGYIGNNMSMNNHPCSTEASTIAAELSAVHNVLTELDWIQMSRTYSIRFLKIIDVTWDNIE